MNAVGTNSTRMRMYSLRSICRCFKIKVARIGEHVFSTLGGDDAIPHDLACHYIRGTRGDFSWVIDEVALNRYPESIGIGFL